MKKCRLSTFVLLLVGVINSDFASAEYGDVHKCDEFGAHIDDVGKWAQGNTDKQLATGPALKFCTQAVQKHPETARFWFQLGRAQYKAGHHSEALQSLLQAQKLGYSPSGYYLALIMGNSEQSGQLLQAAAEVFDPAAELLNAQYQYEQEQFALNRPLDPNDFAKPKYAAAIYHGDFLYLNRMVYQYPSTYISTINELFLSEMKLIDPNCYTLADAVLDDKIENQQMKLIFGTDKAEAADRASGAFSLDPARREQIAAKNFSTLIDVFNKFQSGELQFRADLQDKIRFVRKEAAKDALTLASKYGCSSNAVKRFHQNAVAYINGREPAYFSGEVISRGLEGVEHSCLYYATLNDHVTPKTQSTCKCISDSFSGFVVPDEVENWFIENYDQGKNFATLLSKSDRLKQRITQCLLSE